MRVIKRDHFHQVKAFELGWSILGPPLMTTRCYVIGDVMVDTGLSHMRKEVIDIAADHRIQRICLTHYHEDHSGNAGPIRQAFGTTVFGHPGTAKKTEKSFKILPYQKYMWGKAPPVKVVQVPDRIETVLGTMVPVHTPGHSKDHTAYYIRNEGVVFSGDLYLGDRIKYFRAEEDIGAQIHSLQNLLALDFDMLLCSHAPRRKNGRTHIQRKLDFLQDLYGSIIRLWENGLSDNRIFSELRLKENYFAKGFCFGDVSMINGVRSVIRHHQIKTSA